MANLPTVAERTTEVEQVSGPSHGIYALLVVNAVCIGDGPSISYRDVLMDVHYNAAFVRECVAAPSRMICVPDT